MWKYKLPILFLILMSFTALAAPAKFGINFYDEANFLAPAMCNVKHNGNKPSSVTGYFANYSKL